MKEQAGLTSQVRRFLKVWCKRQWETLDEQYNRSVIKTGVYSVHSEKKMAEGHVEIVYALLIIGGGRGSNTLR